MNIRPSYLLHGFFGDLFSNKTQVLNHDVRVRWIDEEKLRKETRTFPPEQAGK